MRTTRTWSVSPRHHVAVAGRTAASFSGIIRGLGAPFSRHTARGGAQAALRCGRGKVIPREKIQIVHGHHGAIFGQQFSQQTLRHAPEDCCSLGTWQKAQLLVQPAVSAEPVRCAPSRMSEFVAKVFAANGLRTRLARTGTAHAPHAW